MEAKIIMPQQHDPTEETGPREHAQERFASPEHMIDLAQAISKLRNEASTIRHGHRQITLYHQRPVTLVLFAFEEGGGLDDHKAAGVVTIHALEGELTVRTEAQEYRLSSGMMVMLAPNVQHSVHATQPSAMLLTVCLSNE
jgi:quercetin dioxygenase-like cupin family protein